MDTSRITRLSRALVTRVNRRTSLGLATTGVAALGLTPAADAKKKQKKKITLCFNRQTVKKPKESARKLLKEGASKGACSCGNGGLCFAFVTAATFTGSALGGLSGADTACQSAANAAGLPGTYLAWLSANGSTPTSRFTNTSNAGPYVRVLAPANGRGPGVGPIVANSFAEMLACTGGICQASPKSEPERGQTAPGIPVWTGTTSNGAAAADTCLGWTSDAVFGLVGNQRQADQKWTDDGTNPCNEARPIYCFQQAS